MNWLEAYKNEDCFVTFASQDPPLSSSTDKQDSGNENNKTSLIFLLKPITSQ
jgi:hypothetical protein